MIKKADDDYIIWETVGNDPELVIELLFHLCTY